MQQSNSLQNYSLLHTNVSSWHNIHLSYSVVTQQETSTETKTLVYLFRDPREALCLTVGLMTASTSPVIMGVY